MSIPISQLNILFETLKDSGITINTVIVDELPRDFKTNAMFNQMFTNYGIVTFETKKTIKRIIISQLESYIRDSLSI